MLNEATVTGAPDEFWTVRKKLNTAVSKSKTYNSAAQRDKQCSGSNPHIYMVSGG
jgi:hypothetical protein